MVIGVFRHMRLLFCLLQDTLCPYRPLHVATLINPGILWRQVTEAGGYNSRRARSGIKQYFITETQKLSQ